MKIQVFAALKDYFEKEFIVESFDNISALKEYLIAENERSEKILNLCRFAVNNEFVDLNYTIKPNDTISIIPPSSGG